MPWKEHLPKMQVVAHGGASKTRPQLLEKSRGQLQHTETSYRLFDTKSCVTTAETSGLRVYSHIF
jgi:hypothetical protein